MYRFNVYLNFKNGEFKLLTTYACYASNREEAKAKAQAWAESAYSDENVSVMATN